MNNYQTAKQILYKFHFFQFIILLVGYLINVSANKYSHHRAFVIFLFDGNNEYRSFLPEYLVLRRFLCKEVLLLKSYRFLYFYCVNIIYCSLCKAQLYVTLPKKSNFAGTGFFIFCSDASLFYTNVFLRTKPVCYRV